LRSGNAEQRDEAARQIWLRYSSRLLELLRRRLNERIRRREDESDIAQRLYLVFCQLWEKRAERVVSREEVWRLLVCLAVRKAATAATYHTAGRRDVRREESPTLGEGDSPRWLLEHMDASEPDPLEALVVKEQIERLPEELRQVVVLRLEGHTNKEIAAKIRRTERTVELRLRRVRQLWDGGADEGPARDGSEGRETNVQ
jgi:DNA-directed RNA polymerase specialized sigma24 family protein